MSEDGTSIIHASGAVWVWIQNIYFWSWRKEENKTVANKRGEILEKFFTFQDHLINTKYNSFKVLLTGK